MEKYLATVNRRADIEAARQEARQQSLQVSITRGAMLPTLNLEFSRYLGRSGNLSKSKWDTSVALELPLFQGGILRSQVREESARQKELENKVTLLTREATAEVRRLHQSLLSSLKQARAYQEAQSKAEKSYRLQLRDYRLGLVNNLDVIQALTALSDARRNLDRTLIQVKSDQALLELAAGND